MQARGLAAALKPGLRALGNHSSLVTVAQPRKPSHSVALDEALKEQFPNAPRWDYGIGLQSGRHDSVAWVEVHPATSGEVDTVLAKLKWLKAWLSESAGACQGAAMSFHWVATRGVHIDNQRRRKLNAAGLHMPQSQLRL